VASDYSFTPSSAATVSTGVSITPLALTVSGQSISGTLTKTYDGNTSTAATLSDGVVSGGLSGDVISLSGQTLAYNSAHVVGANSISSSGTGALSVSGGTATSVASDYSFTPSSAATVSTGVSITAKAVTLTAPALTKTYDGGLTYTTQAADLSALSAQLGVSGDTVSAATLAYLDKNVASNKAVTLNGVTLVDGNSTPGANYTLTLAGNSISSISRLSSVTWIGSATGNWFDPANWAGRAVPDLSNVANVVIPQGVTVSFDNANVVAPVQAGAVNVDTIGSAGNLSLLAGNLNVVTSLQVTALTQTGGALTGGANIAVASFEQNGGSVATSVNFIASSSFTQAGVGTLAVGGNVGIAQAAGPVDQMHRHEGFQVGAGARQGDDRERADRRGHRAVRRVFQTRARIEDRRPDVGAPRIRAV
jgi:hypothetical protein